MRAMRATSLPAEAGRARPPGVQGCRSARFGRRSRQASLPTEREREPAVQPISDRTKGESRRP
jgi:hypothetical protein